MASLPSGLPELIGQEEDLARFLTQSRQFNVTLVKPAALLPSPTDKETSVSRHGREPAERLWEPGAAAAGERTLYGAAILTAAAVVPPLVVEADEPPPRHAAIRGWPWIPDDPDLQKAQQKELAALLASAAGAPVLRPISTRRGAAT